jgi:hypothetical protein
MAAGRSPVTRWSPARAAATLDYMVTVPVPVDADRSMQAEIDIGDLRFMRVLAVHAPAPSRRAV